MERAARCIGEGRQQLDSMNNEQKIENESERAVASTAAHVCQFARPAAPEPAHPCPCPQTPRVC